jgi:hypothetical protein
VQKITPEVVTTEIPSSEKRDNKTLLENMYSIA